MLTAYFDLFIKYPPEVKHDYCVRNEPRNLEVIKFQSFGTTSVKPLDSTSGLQIRKTSSPTEDSSSSHWVFVRPIPERRHIILVCTSVGNSGHSLSGKAKSLISNRK